MESIVNALDYLVEKYNLDISKKSPIEIPNISRDILAHWFKDLGFTKGAEIGVYEASYSMTLLRANSKLKLYCIDPWEPLPEYGDELRMEIAYQTALKSLQDTHSVIIRKYSKDAVTDFEPGSLDFVYIDGDHSLHGASFDIENWSQIVRPGGIVSGHDFEDYWSRYAKNYQVKEAVLEYVNGHNIDPWFIFDGRPDYVKGKTKRIPKSWMWIKE